MWQWRTILGLRLGLCSRCALYKLGLRLLLPSQQSDALPDALPDVLPDALPDALPARPVPGVSEVGRDWLVLRDI